MVYCLIWYCFRVSMSQPSSNIQNLYWIYWQSLCIESFPGTEENRNSWRLLYDIPAIAPHIYINHSWIAPALDMATVVWRDVTRQQLVPGMQPCGRLVNNVNTEGQVTIAWCHYCWYCGQQQWQWRWWWCYSVVIVVVLLLLCSDSGGVVVTL